MKQVIILALLLTVSGCGFGFEPTPDRSQRLAPSAITYKTGERFKIERVGVFTDSLAYDNERGIYVIIDTETNQQFIGVSGIGISELASHKSGKIRHNDER